MVRNRHTDHLADEPEYGVPFNARHADQVARATNSILNEMCQDIGVNNFNDLTSHNLNKRSVLKEKLCDWLETVCYTLNCFASPHLQMAVERIDELNTSQTKVQQNVIELQSKLIEKRDEELKLLKDTFQNEVKSVQNTVQNELKSYSSALTKTCAGALAPKKIRAAVKTVADKEDRSRNVIVYGLTESDGEVLESKVLGILDEIGEKPLIKESCRVGFKRPDTTRPVKFTLNSTDMVSQVLRKAKLLRTKEGYSTIYLCPDRTVDERQAFKKLLEDLKAIKKAEPNKVHVIRNNKIVSSERDSVSAQSDNI